MPTLPNAWVTHWEEKPTAKVRENGELSIRFAWGTSC